MVSFYTLPPYYRDVSRRSQSAYQKGCMHNLPREQVYFNLNYKLDQKPQWDFSPSFLPSDNIRLFGLRVPWTVTFPVRFSRGTHCWDWEPCGAFRIYDLVNKLSVTFFTETWRQEWRLLGWYLSFRSCERSHIVYLEQQAQTKLWNMLHLPPVRDPGSTGMILQTL